MKMLLRVLCARGFEPALYEAAEPALANPYAAVNRGLRRSFAGCQRSGTLVMIGVWIALGMCRWQVSLIAGAVADCLVPYPEGNGPVAALVEGTDGSFYGATLRGGPKGDFGTIFRIEPRGRFTILHSFEGADGSAPNSLLQGRDGGLYGATGIGGSANRGTIFRLDPSGALATLHEFQDSDGAYPALARKQAMDGSIYGATYLGGKQNLGTIFRLDPAGGFTTLHNFQGSDGAGPLEPPVLAEDGSLYGTTTYTGVGAQFPFGTVYRLDPPVDPAADPRWHLTMLHVFEGTDGAHPIAALIQGKDHNFYGTTLGEGTNYRGKVFRIDLAGVVTNLYEFGGAEGAEPRAALLQDMDGNFYGTTYRGGRNGLGTVFRLDPAGVLSTLHEFQGTDGAEPRTALIRGADGNLYGTTAHDDFSPTNHGTVFRLDPAGALVTLHFFRRKEGVVDCNSNDYLDECDVGLGLSPDCNGNDAPDECDIASGTMQDCNSNAIPDECDIDSGASSDSNHDRIPDECASAGGRQLPGDCNQDGTLDLSDGICLLGHLFLGAPSAMPCDGDTILDPGNIALLDSNGDARVDLSDAVRVLVYLVGGSGPPVLGDACVPIAGCPNNSANCAAE